MSQQLTLDLSATTSLVPRSSLQKSLNPRMEREKFTFRVRGECAILSSCEQDKGKHHKTIPRSQIAPDLERASGGRSCSLPGDAKQFWTSPCCTLRVRQARYLNKLFWLRVFTYVWAVFAGRPMWGLVWINKRIMLENSDGELSVRSEESECDMKRRNAFICRRYFSLALSSKMKIKIRKTLDENSFSSIAAKLLESRLRQTTQKCFARSLIFHVLCYGWHDGVCWN